MGAPPWIKMWLEARTDRKLDRLTDAQHRVWFNLLLYAAEQDVRGTFADDGLLALEVAKGKQKALDSTIEALLSFRIIERDDDAGLYVFHAFTERQVVKPSETPEAWRERQQRKRDRDKQASHDPSHPVTRDCHEEVEVEGEQIEDPSLQGLTGSQRIDRGVRHDDDPGPVLDYTSAKLGDRTLTADEKRSIRRWVKKHGAGETMVQLGYELPKRGLDLAYIGTCIANAAQGP